ncbi:MAG TPA: response regulator [bacterium]|nr:response regulator [bacterium]
MSKILIVDDNRMILQALSDHLEALGYDTEVAASGIDALEILKHDKPDLIIMDIVMPEMSGIEVTRRIRANPEIKSIPVVAFTSQSNRGQWDEIFDDYLVKPFGYDALYEIIQRFIAKKEEADFI